ncbi:MAG: glycosyltransferase [Acidimicrobiia bacterium]|nr:glycosyltransferase [Acidimicrobiia bacterium]
MTPLRLAILTDYPDEGWPSMDLCADMLLAHLPRTGPCAVAPEPVCPPFRRLFTHLPVAGRRQVAFNIDRLINRFIHFPRYAHRQTPRFDLFHVADHTYAQLVHALPRGRVGVYCHDIDAFLCLIDPARYPRPRWFRALARRILTGLQKAAVVFHSTGSVREQITRHGLIDPGKLVHAPFGVAAEFTSPAAPAPQPSWLSRLGGRPWVLHVGSCISRKRIDVLLDVIVGVRKAVPGVRLVKVDGEWSAGHREQIDRLGLGDAIIHARGVPRAELAEAYRRAGAVLLPSEAEGFGLPVIEALACGAAVVASDLPALREVGGPAAVYAPVADVPVWAELVARVLTDPAAAPPRADRLAWAGRYSWAAHAETIAAAYHRLLEAHPCVGSPV